MANININSPIAGALDKLQQTSMQMWQQRQRIRESNKAKRLRFGADLMKQSVGGLGITSTDEEFKTAIEAVKGFEKDKFLGDTSKLVQAKITSMQGIAGKRTDSLNEWNSLFQESRDAAKAWATDDMGQLINDLKDVNMGDLEYLTAEDKRTMEKQLANITGELQAKSIMSNLIPEIHQIREGGGKKPAGMDSRLFNSAIEASALIDAGDWQGVFTEMASYDDTKNAIFKEDRMTTRSRQLYKDVMMTQSEGIPDELQNQAKLITSLYDTNQSEKLVTEIADYVSKRDAMTGTASDQQKAVEQFDKETNQQLNVMLDHVSSDKDFSFDKETQELIKSAKQTVTEGSTGEGIYVEKMQQIGDAIISELQGVYGDNENPYGNVSRTGKNAKENFMWYLGYQPKKVDGRIQKDENNKVVWVVDERAANLTGYARQQELRKITKERVDAADYSKLPFNKGNFKKNTSKRKKTLVELFDVYHFLNNAHSTRRDRFGGADLGGQLIGEDTSDMDSLQEAMYNNQDYLDDFNFTRYGAHIR